MGAVPGRVKASMRCRAESSLKSAVRVYDISERRAGLDGCKG